MKISDIFKKKPVPAVKSVVGKKEEQKKELVKKTGEKKPARSATSVAGGEVDKGAPKKEIVKHKKSVATVYNIVSEPHISEKSMSLGGINQYIFDVFPEANKTKIKEAIEIIYGVDVLSVNIINIAPKKRRLGKNQGFKKGYKKAIVKIKQGQKIELV